MSGTLHIVSTPIGNLEDVTLRALRVLREASLIAAEDTRRTLKLLNHYGIQKPLTSFHEHNERQKTPTLLRRLHEGASIALVADAGTPLISDPGRHLVTAAQQAGIRIEAVPGPSAVLAALVSSGAPSDRFCFVGFPPNRSKDRNRWLASLASERDTLIFFEAPHRIRQTLQEAQQHFGERPITVCRELTKRYEELVKGPISYVLDELKEPRGEYTVVVAPLAEKASKPAPALEDAELAAEFGRMTNEIGLSRRNALASLARAHGLPRRAVFAALERDKNRSNNRKP